MAFALSRYSFFGRQTLSLLVILPIALPGIVTALALRTAFRSILGIELSIWRVVVAHATFCIVVIYDNVIARLRRLGTSLEEASMDLGADTFTTFARITFPNLRGAFFAGGLLAFGLPLDEIVVTLFAAQPGVTTLPMDLPPVQTQPGARRQRGRRGAGDPVDRADLHQPATVRGVHRRRPHLAATAFSQAMPSLSRSRPGWSSSRFCRGRSLRLNEVTGVPEVLSVCTHPADSVRSTSCHLRAVLPLGRPAARVGHEHGEVPAPPSSGASSCTIVAGWFGDERAHRSMRVTMSPAIFTGASNALPSRRARNASATSFAVWTRGGGAGTSTRRAPSRQIASTMPVSAERVSARRSTLRSSTRMLPGMFVAMRSSRAASTSAGVHRTEYEPLESLALALRRVRRRSCGTIAPRRELDGPDRDDRPANGRSNSRRRRPDRCRPRPANRARRRPGSRGRRHARRPTAPRRGAPSTPPPARPPRPATRRLPSRCRPVRAQPPAQATTRPGSHDTWSCVCPSGAVAAASPDRTSRSPRRRDEASRLHRAFGKLAVDRGLEPLDLELRSATT